MSPTDAAFLIAESREAPMHVGGLYLFDPPEGATALDVRDMFYATVENGGASPDFRRKARRSVTTLGQWGWENDREFDLEYHVRRSALPRPGRTLELMALASRLHGTLLDRTRPLWETNLIEGLDDGRFAVYFKVHHSMMDGVASLRLLQRAFSPDPSLRGMPAPWNLPSLPKPPPGEPGGLLTLPFTNAPQIRDFAADVAGIAPALMRTVTRARANQSTVLSLNAPKTMFNVPISGARRFAGQSWPLERLTAVRKASRSTVNDVVLAMCSGALRRYLIEHGALPDMPLMAMVPVSLRRDPRAESGNRVGGITCNLGTDHEDAADRLATIRRSMAEGKAALGEMSQLQILAMSTLSLTPAFVNPMIGLDNFVRPPFNITISNVPGPRRPMYWNGARLDSMYPLSIAYNGQALNITCTTYDDEIAFGLTGCRRSVPHLQRILIHLEDELAALEKAVGVPESG